MSPGQLSLRAVAQQGSEVQALLGGQGTKHNEPKCFQPESTPARDLVEPLWVGWTGAIKFRECLVIALGPD